MEWEEACRSARECVGSGNTGNTFGGSKAPAQKPASAFSGFGKLPAPSSTTNDTAITAPPPQKSPFGSTASVPDFLSTTTTSASADTTSSTEAKLPFASPFGFSAFGGKPSGGTAGGYTSPFGFGGAGGDKGKDKVGEKDGEKEKDGDSAEDKNEEKEKETTASNLFGSNPWASTSSSFSANANKNKKPFGNTNAIHNIFGSPAPTSTAEVEGKGVGKGGFQGFGMGTKSGTFGNPVGFAFGSPPPSSALAPGSGSNAKASDAGAGGSGSIFTPSFGSSSNAFTPFSAPAQPAPPSSTSSTSTPSTFSPQPTGEEGEDDSKHLPTKTHDEEGEGEEGEETVFVGKFKVYKLVREKDEGGEGSEEKVEGKVTWKDCGVG